MLSIQSFVFNHYQVNTYVLYDPETLEAAIIDPAMEYAAEESRLTEFVAEKHLKVRYLLLTHSHVDHLAGTAFAVEQFHLPLHIHPDGQRHFKRAEAYAPFFGFTLPSMKEVKPTDIKATDILTLGNSTIEVREVPGHFPGSVCYVLPAEQAVFTGDALFAGSIGNTELPGGDYDLLIERINSQLLTLPDSYKVYPGHGPSSTIGDERVHNPFLK